MSLTFTADELAGLRTLGNVLDFVGASTLLQEGFFLATSATAASVPRSFGIVPENDFLAMIDEVFIAVPDGEPRKLRFAEKAAILLLGKACRALAGLDLPAAPPPPSGVAPVSVLVKKTKLSQILKQGDDTEIDILPETSIAVGHGRWEAAFGPGKRPAEECECTKEQLSAVKHLLDCDCVPYVDFAIWGPFGHRIERKLRLTGQILQSDGTFRHVEIAGPPNLEVWLAAYDVLMTAFIMLDVLDLGTLLEYKKFISDWHALHGPSCWLLLYQTETRFRLEHLERVRRLTVAAHQ